MRRVLIIALLTAVMFGSVATSDVRAEDSLTVVSWGGAYQEGLMAASWKPAAAKLGITLREDTLSGLENVRLQVLGGNVSWDVVDFGGQHCILGAREGLFEPLDFSVINVEGYPEGTYADHWIGYSFYSSVLAWNTDQVTSTPPQSWADFWDLQKFPGKRGLFRSPDETMEQALLADGIAPEEIYQVLGSKEGLERAISKLEEIKNNVIWWESGAQAAQLLKDGEVALTAIWGARANGVIRDGAHADFTYNQGILGLSCWAIPKGAPNKDLAIKFIAEAGKADYVQHLPENLGYGAVNPRAFDGVPSENLQDINSSPENLSKQLIMNQDFWADHAIPYGERFTDFLTQ